MLNGSVISAAIPESDRNRADGFPHQFAGSTPIHLNLRRRESDISKGLDS